VRGKLVRLFTVFVSSIEARLLILSHKSVSTERAQHTEILLPRDKEPLRFGSTRAKFTRGNIVSTLRGKAINIASCGNHTQSILGLRNFMQKFPNPVFGIHSTSASQYRLYVSQ
jgi:hypothetical protein